MAKAPRPWMIAFLALFSMPCRRRVPPPDWAPRHRRTEATTASVVHRVEEAGLEVVVVDESVAVVASPTRSQAYPLRWSISAERQGSASAVAVWSTVVWSARMLPPPRSQTERPGARAASTTHGVSTARAQPSRIQRASEAQQHGVHRADCRAQYYLSKFTRQRQGCLQLPSTRSRGTHPGGHHDANTNTSRGGKRATTAAITRRAHGAVSAAQGAGQCENGQRRRGASAADD